jgi:hypothetical protein
MCLLGEDGLWSGETLPSLSLVVDEGGVGGSENPGHIKKLPYTSTTLETLQFTERFCSIHNNIR